MIKIIKGMFSKRAKCGICLSTKTASKLISIGKCQTHVFCSDCIAQYVKQKIDYNKLDINCPMYQCPVILSHREVLVLIDKIFRQDNELTKKKYMRLWEMKTDPNFRECSICRSPLKFELDRGSETKCKCGRVSCFTHGIGHPNQSCAQYEKSLVKQKSYQLSIKTISKIAKKCPGCSVPTERNGGSDRMTCSQCGRRWSWNSIYFSHFPPTHPTPLRPALPPSTDTTNAPINDGHGLLFVFVMLFLVICLVCSAVAVIVWFCLKQLRAA